MCDLVSLSFFVQFFSHSCHAMSCHAMHLCYAIAYNKFFIFPFSHCFSCYPSSTPLPHFILGPIPASLLIIRLFTSYNCLFWLLFIAILCLHLAVCVFFPCSLLHLLLYLIRSTLLILSPRHAVLSHYCNSCLLVSSLLVASCDTAKSYILPKLCLDLGRAPPGFCSTSHHLTLDLESCQSSLHVSYYEVRISNASVLIESTATLYFGLILAA